MSYESEERYWTDYLRVALPVIGLLLMLALFWWWAQQFIGNDGDSTDVAASTATAQATIAPPVPTATVPVVVEPTNDGGGEESPTEDPANAGNDEETPTNESQANCDGAFSEDDVVLVTSSGVNFRDEPDASGDNLIEQLDEGTVMTVIADCPEEDSEGNVFWRVRNNETADTGWISEDFIELEE